MFTFVMVLIAITTAYYVVDIVSDWKHPFPLKELEDSPAARVYVKFLAPVWEDNSPPFEAGFLSLPEPLWVTSTLEEVEDTVLNNLQHMHNRIELLSHLPRPKLSRLPLGDQYVYGLYV